VVVALKLKHTFCRRTKVSINIVI